MADQQPMDVAPEWTRAIKVAWDTQKQFSLAASRARASLERWRRPLIALSLLGGIACVLSRELVTWFGSSLEPRWLPVVTGLAGSSFLAFAAYLTKELLSPRVEQEWTRARAISEAVKSHCFQFAVAAAPYEDRAAAVAVFNDKIDELTKGVTGVDLELAEAVDDDSHPHAPIDLDQYLRVRVIGQRDWFQKNAHLAHGLDQRWRRGSMALALLSIALSIVGSTFKDQRLNAWVPVLTTAVAAVASFSFASRFRELATLYSATAFQISRLLARGKEPKLVQHCETVLAAANDAWMAEWSKEGALPSVPLPTVVPEIKPPVE
jgi:hypothetical protein